MKCCMFARWLKLDSLVAKMTLKVPTRYRPHNYIIEMKFSRYGCQIQSHIPFQIYGIGFDYHENSISKK